MDEVITKGAVCGDGRGGGGAVTEGHASKEGFFAIFLLILVLFLRGM
jgi:hypothetical protein